MTNDMAGAPDRESQLHAALLAYVEARQAGREPDRRQLVAAHPDFKVELEEFFAGDDEVERLAGPLRACEGGVLQRSIPNEVAPDIGNLGDFRLLREIGRGGMGVVYEAEQVSLRRRVALKVLPFAAALDPRQIQRFKNEVLAAAQLRHENIVPVYAVGEERGVHYYAMQIVAGWSLAALISELKLPAEANRSTATGTTSPAAVLSSERSSGNRRYYDWVASVGRQAALALEYAHAVGIVHRDVKPANLLLDLEGHLWVTDFGLAQVAGETGLTATGELLGTLRYASPEQVLARRGMVDHRSDVYSLGATLCELLTLEPIFEGGDRNELLRQVADEEPRPPRSMDPSVPWELDTIVLKALSKEPSERYARAQELADDLKRFLDNQLVLARRPTSAERLWKVARRHPSLVAASIVMLLLVTAGSLLSAVLIRGEQARTEIEQRKAEEAYQRERQRSEEAEARFALARRSVDEMFRISQEELADRPGLEGLRKRLLWSVLAFYQEFLEQRKDDAKALADLQGAKERIENILADLAVLRAATKLYLLHQPAVIDDLHLDDKQRPKVKEFCARVGKEWLESLRLPPAERQRRDIERARTYEAEVNVLLTAAQRLRLRQIGLQAEGPVAFGEPEVIAELKLTAKQREKIRTIEEDALFGWMRRPLSGTSDANKTSGGREKSTNERILAVLTEEQNQRWQAMTGAPLKGSITPFLPQSVFLGAPAMKGPSR
jgi:serine/threonine protein kinase